MSLLYIEEHTTCSNYYVSGFNVGFKICNIKAKDSLDLSHYNHNCLIFSLSGEARLNYQSKEYVLKPKSIVFLPMSNVFELRAITPYNAVVHYFNTPVELCEKLSMEQLSEYVDNPEFTILNTVEILDNFLASMCFYIKQGAACKHFQEIKHQELFFIFRFLYTKEAIARLFSPIISKNIDFKSLVLLNYKNASSVQTLAKLCNHSAPSFYRFFKLNFNENPLSWLQNKRLQHIVSKLSDPSIPLVEIADEFGFSSAGHFTTFCRKNLGKTPREFRKGINQ
ncbi:MAG: helix-turn-helix transcriptional regulator [Prevotellaceae bacterium]|jgi:AraC-like DNA-binding protein|nr:helix-turn-helix transcriptional regulator [Prevotellaceae bacterium]